MATGDDDNNDNDGDGAAGDKVDNDGNNDDYGDRRRRRQLRRRDGRRATGYDIAGDLANYVADMSPTRENVGKFAQNCMSAATRHMKKESPTRPICVSFCRH
jgi:hypothetical protein